jgi:hypothetical protein
VTDHERPLPSLYRNGALDPDNWSPESANLKYGAGRGLAEEGDLVGWRYGAWRVVEARVVDDTDLTPETVARLDRLVNGLRPEFRDKARWRNRPRRIVLRHESGPLILKPGEPAKTLHDGAVTLHFGTSFDANLAWSVLTDPYRVCSCHGHIWPCQDYDRDVLAQHEARKTEKLYATTDPGVCAHCLEAITTRQKTITFPEESRLVPGAPGPTFHAGRAACWGAAEKYEREGRLTDNPEVLRIASCPGVRFIHEARNLPTDRRLDCTAGPHCTGHHGPAGYRQDPPCWFRVMVAANNGAYPRPSFDCGYHDGHGTCLGADMSGGGSSISPIAADLIWDQRTRR